MSQHLILAPTGAGKSHYVRQHLDPANIHMWDGDVVVRAMVGWPPVDRWWRHPNASAVQYATFAAIRRAMSPDVLGVTFVHDGDVQTADFTRLRTVLFNGDPYALETIMDVYEWNPRVIVVLPPEEVHRTRLSARERDGSLFQPVDWTTASRNRQMLRAAAERYGWEISNSFTGVVEL